MRSLPSLRRVRLLAALLILVVCPLRSSASGGYPLLFNYSYEQYGTDADLQNWDITQSETGEIFVGNNNCLLRFDGSSWQKISSYGNRIFRSVCAADGRLYAGRHNEFGYLEKDEFGKYEFRSLSAGKPVMQDNEQIWNIIPLGSSVYFQSFSALYALENDSVSQIELGFSPFCIYTDHINLYVQAIDGDFYRMDAGKPTLLFGRKEIGNCDVVGFFGTKEPDTYLIVSSNRGIFKYRQGKISAFRTEADRLLQTYAVNKSCRTRNGDIVIGTYRSGIICLNQEGKVLWHYNSETGLRNDCVLRLLADKDDNIWACMDDGVALIANGAPFRIIGDKIGNQSIGMVYGINRRGTELLIATNQGVYRCRPDDLRPSPELIPGTEGQNWHLTEIDGTLYCGHNSCLLRYENGRFVPVAGTYGSSTSMRKFSNSNGNYIIESTYSVLRLYRQEGGKWGKPEVIQGFAHPVRTLETDADGTIWAADLDVGIYRILLSEDMKSVEKVSYYPEVDGVSGRCFVMRFGGQVVFSNGKRLYRYDDQTETFEAFNRINDLLPSAEGVINITESSRGRYIISSQSGCARIVHEGDEWKLLRVISNSSLGYRNNDVAANAYVNEGRTYFNMSGAVLIFDPSLSRAETDVAFFLQQADYITRKGESVSLSTDRLLKGDARIRGSLQLQFAYPRFVSDGISYTFEVEQAGQRFSIESNTPDIHLTNLRYGTTHVTARVLAADGSVLAEERVGFRNMPPWYISWWVLLFYLFLIIALAQLIVRYQVQKKTERQRLKLLEQDRIISEQKQQLLESELALKSKDLASLSLDAALKDNVIDSIQQAIRLQQKQGKIAQGTFNAELLRIRQTTGSEKNWAVFQQNFDLIHEHFFRNLKEQFPSLTTSDLRLCALLRLNMATKDIATYTGLSVRGVESARFRLRKKLNLDPEQNLSEFLLSFK